MTARTRDEYAKTPQVQERVRERQAIHNQSLAMISQAAVKAETLTGHPAWDTYLSYLQAFVEQTQALEAQYQQKLNDPLTVGHIEMLVAKIGLAECTAIIRALTTAMELPKDIIEHGVAAKDMIERMKDKAA